MKSTRLPILLLLLIFRTGCSGETAEKFTAVESGAGQASSEPSLSPIPSNEAAAASGQDALVASFSYNLREGRRLFQYYCAGCQGDQGEGDGFNASNLNPKPRNLTDPEFQKQRRDQDLFNVIRTGGGAAGLSAGMPPWGRTLNQRQIKNLVLYLRKLPELQPANLEEEQK